MILRLQDRGKEPQRGQREAVGYKPPSHGRRLLKKCVETEDPESQSHRAQPQLRGDPEFIGWSAL